MSAITRRQMGAGLALTAAVAALPANASGQAVAPGAPGDPRPQSYALLNAPAPEFAFPGLQSRQHRLQDYRGQVLVLYFWGLWCPDCVADGANVNALARAVSRETGMAFLGIHTRGRFGRWGSVPRYFEETGYEFPTAFDEGRAFARDTYRIAWFPTFLAIDPEGVIRAWRTDLGDQGGAAFLAQARALRA